MAELAMEVEVIEINEKDLVPCHICGRTFLPAPLKKHINVCEKNATKKRKKFDSLKQRVLGTELAAFHQLSYLKKHNKDQHIPSSDTKTVEKSKTNWKEKHHALVEAIRAARSNKPSPSTMAPRRSISASGTMGCTSRCPSCDRQFGPKAFDRHVEWCREKRTRNFQQSPATVQAAKERLEARTKYKAPLGKSKRSLTRDKYQPGRSSESIDEDTRDEKARIGRDTTVREQSRNVHREVKRIQVSEPVIKSKRSDVGEKIVEKSKSVPLKMKIKPLQINKSDINDSVVGMTVSQVNLSSSTNLVTWNNTNTNKQKKKIPKYPKTVAKKSVCNKTEESDYENISLNLKRNVDKNITFIKEPASNFHNFDADSLYESESTLNTDRNDLNKATDNISDENTEDNSPATTTKIWETAEIEFLTSLKSKSDTNSEVFSNNLREKFTSTPLEKNYNFRDFNTGSLICRSEDNNFSCETSSIIDLTHLKTNSNCVEKFSRVENSPRTPVEFKMDIPKEISPRKPVELVDNRDYSEEIFSEENFDDKEISEKIKIISQSYDLLEENFITPTESIDTLELNTYIPEEYVSPRTPKKLPKKTRTPKKSPQLHKITKTSRKSSQLPRITKTPQETPRVSPKNNIKTCNISDLQEFLKNISSKCQIQLEVIATESKISKKNMPPDVKLFRENSKEIVIQGEKSQKIINQLLSQNDIKSVNVVFINEDLKVIPESPKRLIDLELQPISSKVAVKVAKIKKKYLKRTRKRKKDAGDKEKLLKLPLIENMEKCGAKKIDRFWENLSNKTNISNPLIIQKSHIHSNESRYKINNKEKNEMCPEILSPATPPNSESSSFLPPIIKEPNSATTYKNVQPDYNPFVIAEKQLQELLNCDDLNSSYSSSIATNTRAQSTPAKSTKSTPAKNTKSTPNKRASVIDPPKDFKDKINSLQDNFELIENFINDNFVEQNDNIKAKSKETLSLNAILSHRKYSDDNSLIDPRLINEVDNLHIPEKLFVENPSPVYLNNDVDHYSQQYDKNISVLDSKKNQKSSFKRSVSSHNDKTIDDIDFDEFISSFDDDDSFPTLKTFLQTSKTDNTNISSAKKTKKVLQKSTQSLHSSHGKNTDSKQTENRNKILSPLKRSVSLSNPLTKARSMKNKQDINDYLHVKDTKKVPSPPQKSLSPKSSDELFPENHELYDEYKRFQEEYKREARGFEHKMASGDESSNDEMRQHRPRDNFKEKIIEGKFSGDSAYGSLNRKSPKIQPKIPPNRLPVQRGVSLERSSSSSGSETMATTPLKKSPSVHKLSKFCHECGSKYPLDTAKFCVECGIKRLVL